MAREGSKGTRPMMLADVSDLKEGSSTSGLIVTATWVTVNVLPILSRWALSWCFVTVCRVGESALKFLSYDPPYHITMRMRLDLRGYCVSIFPHLYAGAVKSPLRSSSGKVALYIALDLLCPWKEMSSALSYAAILPFFRSGNNL